jgi:CRISPR-associated protein Cas2
MALKGKDMAGKSFYVVVYDISNNKRRTKLHTALMNYGSPVQYSVFECILEKTEYNQLKETVRKIIRPRLDHVRYYRFCASCRDKIEVIGRTEIVSEKEVIVV